MLKNKIHSVVCVVQISLFLTLIPTVPLLIAFPGGNITPGVINLVFNFLVLPLVLSCITSSQVILFLRQESVQLLRNRYFFLELVKIFLCSISINVMVAYAVLLPVYVLFWAKFMLLRQASVNWSIVNLKKKLFLKIRLALGGSLLIAYLLTVGLAHLSASTAFLVPADSSPFSIIYLNEYVLEVTSLLYVRTAFPFLALFYGLIWTTGIFLLFFLNIESKRIVLRSLPKPILDDTPDTLY